MKKLLPIILILFYLFTVLSISYFLPRNYVLLLAISFSTILILVLVGFFMHHNYKKLEGKLVNHEQTIRSNYNQIESLFSIFSVLKISKPLPAFRGWSISPDFGNIIIQNTLENKPEYILECGSGVSSIIMSYLIKDKNWGTLNSLEHDEKFARRTIELLESHEISKKTVVHVVDLIQYKVKNEDWKWYDISHLNPVTKYDMLIVDGPPANVYPKSRFPTLHILDKYLNIGAIILIDDCRRVEDNNIVKKWMEDFSNNYSFEWIDTEKGTYQLVKLK